MSLWSKGCRGAGCSVRGQLEMKETKDLLFFVFFLGGILGMVSGGGSCVPARCIRVGATGWLACPKRVM